MKVLQTLQTISKDTRERDRRLFAVLDRLSEVRKTENGDKWTDSAQVFRS